MLSNYDIQDICKSMELHIVGVYSKDLLPNKNYVGSYYVNMEDHDEGNGTHWVMCKIFENGTAIYFDSFGVYPPEDINNFLNIFKPYIRNNREIQDIKSENCGWFCILCDYYSRDEETFEKFLRCWSDDTKKNDKILFELMKRFD